VENEEEKGEARAFEIRVLPSFTEVTQDRRRRYRETFTQQLTLRKTHNVVGVVEFPEGMNHQRAESSPKRLPRLS
jgi:hypothetical protein